MKSNNLKLLGASLTLALLGGGILTTSQPSNAHIKCPIKVFGTTNDKCPHPPHLEGLSEEAWGEAGRVAYQGAAATMSKRSPTGEPLDASLKYALRPHFGGLVDRVTLHWGTPGLDEWSANKIGINLSGTKSAAQTYGHDIYLRQQKPSSYSQSLVGLIIHEMTHSQQYENYSSSLSNFGYNYFKKYKQAGQSYENNELEKKAHELQGNLTSSVYVALIQEVESAAKKADTSSSPSIDIVARKGNEKSQQWKLEKLSNGRYVIWSSNGTHVMDVPRGNVVSFVSRQTGERSQQWKLEKLSNGNHIIWTHDKSQVIDVPRGNTVTLASRQSREKSQQWRLEKLSNGNHIIWTHNQSQVMDVP